MFYSSIVGFLLETHIYGCFSLQAALTILSFLGIRGFDHLRHRKQETMKNNQGKTQYINYIKYIKYSNFKEKYYQVVFKISSTIDNVMARRRKRFNARTRVGY